MYLFWHAIFTALLAILLCRIANANPARLHLLTTVSAGVLVDLDHLFSWNPKYLSQLFPTYLGEGLTLALRTNVYPCIFHLWLWPLTLLAATITLRRKKLHKYMLAAAAGWALHLALDGVVVLL